MSILSKGLHLQCSRNFDTPLDRAGNRAKLSMKFVDAFCGIMMFFSNLQRIGHMYAANDQHFVIFSNVTFCLRGEVPLAGWDSARLQRATKGPR
jgi:hypothetical protein